MEPRALVWIGLGGILFAAGVAHFDWHEKDASSLEFPITRPAPVSTPATAPIAVLSDDELLCAATNGGSADFAFALAKKWLAEDPLDDKARVSRLMLALCNDGQFRAALALANTAPAPLQTNWLQLTFLRWAQRQPQTALKSLEAVTDPALRSVAFRAAADGWNQNDPGGLAAYAIALPDGDDRAYALAEALDNWSLQDPAALATWLNSLPRGIEFDAGAAWMVAKTDGANRSPEVAMAWVENISDPVLQQDSFNRVIAEWAQTDRQAAQQYVASTDWLTDSERTKILASFAAR